MPKLNRLSKFFIYLTFSSLIACSPNPSKEENDQPVALQLTDTQSTDAQYISWKEHLVDDSQLGGIDLSGSDGLVMADLDKDGYEDIISVHESDTHYDGNANGHIRIAFGSADPDKWELFTLADGSNAGAAEDVAVDDLNGDGFLDVIAACELSHLIYFQNPGENIRTQSWPYLIPSITKDRGSFIRVFFADLDQDGTPEITSPNKGNQSPGEEEPLNNISWFDVKGNPLQDSSWVEHVLAKVKIPINARPVDVDQDGDLDIIGGAWGEGRIIWFENISENGIKFKEHPVKIIGSAFEGQEEPEPYNQFEDAFIIGFNMDFYDFNKDGRLDILTCENLFGHLVWLEQPKNPQEAWPLHPLGHFRPDQLVGFTIADINSDEWPDIIAGAYSRGPRDEDGEVTVNDGLGRLAWFENPGTLDKIWTRHDISRRKRGMYDKFIAKDMDQDGDIDFVGTRGNSRPYDGVFWLEQLRTKDAQQRFIQARKSESQEMALPE